MATVVAVRHGQTAWNRADRVQGWTDSELTDLGRQQARATGEHLASTRAVDRLVVSDLERTRETAAAFEAGGLAVDPTYSEAWRERGFGSYEGLGRAELVETLDSFEMGASLFCSAGAPDGESLATVRERVVEGFDRLRTDLDDGETAVVVTHGGPVRALVAAVTGADVQAVAHRLTPSNCGLTEVDLTGDPSLVREDDTAHLPDETR